MRNSFHPIRVIVAEELARYRQELRQSLQNESDLEIVGEASDARVALQLTLRNRPDILLLDLGLARAGQFKMLTDLASQLPAMRVIVTVAAIQKDDLINVIRCGAHGVVLKSSAQDLLIKSIRSVVAGQYWVERDGVGVLVEVLRESLRSDNTAALKDYGLTPREVDIISKVASGRSNKEVGEEFAISERTVKHHLTNIFSKIGVSSRLQLALFAVNQQLTTIPAPRLTLQSAQTEEDI